MEIQRHNFPLSAKIKNILAAFFALAHKIFSLRRILCRTMRIALGQGSGRPPPLAI
jgi:hypothetical protein